MLLHGIFPPSTTPYKADGEVYFRKLEQNVERYSRTPVAGMVALGSTGEAVLLSDQERRDVLRCVAEVASPAKVLIAGTGAESAIETLRLTEYAADLGYDVALVRTPSFYKSQTAAPANMLAFYRFVADRSPLPVLVYNYPQVTGYDIPAELVAVLAEHPNVVGIKESSASAEKVKALLEGTKSIRRSAMVTETFEALTSRMRKSATVHASDALPIVSSNAVTVMDGIRVREKEVGFQVLVGAAQSLLDLLQAGAVGGVLAFADAAPTAMYEIYSAWKNGDLAIAHDKQQRVTAAAARVAGDLGIPGVKYACELNGYYGGPVRLPLLPLTAELKCEVERLMAKIRN
jgi:dihydrodipicolinate synthase/N-acetylneuraminate lyase